MGVSVYFWAHIQVVFMVAFRVAVIDMGFTVRSVVVLLSTSTCWGVLVGLQEGE